MIDQALANAIDTHFAPEVRPALVEQGAVNLEAFHYSQALLEQARRQGVKEGLAEETGYRPAARDQGFRRAIVTAYDHRCAVCGIRMLTADGHTAVDAAHIVPWSVSHDDDPRNGMALCRLCHRTFDEGLVGVSPRYAVLTSTTSPVTCWRWPVAASSAPPRNRCGPTGKRCAGTGGTCFAGGSNRLSLFIV